MRQLEQFVQKNMPIESQEPWDNGGLLIGRENKKIKKILLALDLTEETLSAAIKETVDLVFTHHPLIFAGIKEITDRDYKGRLVMEMMRHDISLYSAHSNWDISLAGSSHWLAGKLKLEKMEETSAAYIQVGSLLSSIPLEDFLPLVQSILCTDYLIYGGDLHQPIRKVGIIAGSGMSHREEIKQLNCDVFITGDGGYHPMQELVFNHVAVINGGHFATEIHIIDILKQALEAQTDFLVYSANETNIEKLFM